MSRADKTSALINPDIAILSILLTGVLQVEGGAYPHTKWEDDHFVLHLPRAKTHPPVGYSVDLKQGLIKLFER